MRISFKVMPLIVTALAISSCGYKASKTDFTFHYKPDPTKDNFDVTKIVGCTKAESSQTFSDQAKSNVIYVMGEIPNQDQETTDCDGNVTKSHGPIGPLERTRVIAAPASLEGKVHYIQVINQRTCGDDLDNATDTLKVSDQDIKENNDSVPTVVNHDGKIVLSINTIPLRLTRTTELQEGQNAVTVKYFGKCIERNPSASAAAGEAEGCLKGDLLLSQDMTLDLVIARPEIPGVLKVNGCRPAK